MSFSSADCRSGDGGRFALDAPLFHLCSRRSPSSTVRGEVKTPGQSRPPSVRLRVRFLSPPPSNSDSPSLSPALQLQSFFMKLVSLFSIPLSHCRCCCYCCWNQRSFGSLLHTSLSAPPLPFPGHLCKHPHSPSFPRSLCNAARSLEQAFGLCRHSPLFSSHSKHSLWGLFIYSPSSRLAG